MLKDLIKLANRLDDKGLTKEADYLDNIIRKMANSNMPSKSKALRVAGRALANMINIADQALNRDRAEQHEKFKIEEGQPLVLNSNDATKLKSALDAFIHGDDISQISQTIPRITPGVYYISDGTSDKCDFHIGVEDNTNAFYTADFKIDFVMDDSYAGTGEEVCSSATVVVTLTLIEPPTDPYDPSIYE